MYGLGQAACAQDFDVMNMSVYVSYKEKKPHKINGH